MQPDMIRRYGAPVPRYTSYPTANHFAPEAGSKERDAWLASLHGGAKLSLYLHIPFCRSLCWYCACNTKMTRRPDPVTAYLDALSAEIEEVSVRVPRRHEIAHMHWGGGSPSLLAAPDIRRLGGLLRRRFRFSPSAEVAVEVDPRDTDEAQADAFADIGVNRVSLGVQDFDLKVQEAINRVQSFETTAHAVGLFRARGISSINIDLVYGLPHQTELSVGETMRQVLALAPDRIAIFGYAHLPSRVKHQRLIDGRALPGAAERYAQSQCLAAIARTAGYRQVGIDHFARGEDSLARDPVRRNFQGYTTDKADALIGLGASAISQFPQGFVQNATPVHDYERRIQQQGNAAARGIVMSEDDRVRAHVIERLMCDFTFAADELRARFGSAANEVIAEAGRMLAGDRDGLLAPTDDGFTLTEIGRVLARTVAARFDAYLAGSKAMHAIAV